MKLLKILLLIALCQQTYLANAADEKIVFWQSTPRGANMSTDNPNFDFAAASRYGIRLVRFGATGSPGDLRFLVKGTAPDDSWDLSAENIAKLKALIAKATQNNLKVVLSLAHVPGRAWEYRQRDNRIWQDAGYRTELVEAWKILARELKGDPNIVGYDLFNEPYFPQGSAQHLWNLYRDSIGAIRQVDPTMPIIIESPGMASVDTIPNMPVFWDNRVIYSFHYYEPLPYFAPPLNQGRLTYPGMIPSAEGESPSLWNKEVHKKRLSQAREWQEQNGIESHRIFVGEFGVWRKAQGAEEYLRDITSIFSEYGWTWTYYAFREDDWNVTDLEISGDSQDRQETAIFRVIKNQFR